MRRHRQDLQIFSEMNLTNMLDTAFTLLLAFLIVAPMIKHGIELDLPTVVSGPLNPASAQTLTVAVGKSEGPGLTDGIYIEDRRVTLDEMEEAIRERKAMYAPKPLDILLEADTNARYETVAQVLGRLRGLGIENVGLPTQLIDTTPSETAATPVAAPADSAEPAIPLKTSGAANP